MTEISSDGSMFPPERTIATGPAEPPTAPAPSTTSFARSSRRTIASVIASSSMSTMSSRTSSRIDIVRSPGFFTKTPSAIVKPERPAWTPTMRRSGLRSRRAIPIPDASPPPPTGMRTVSACATCSASSSPIVPWPAMTCGSSNGWMNVAPRSSTSAMAAAIASSNRSPSRISSDPYVRQASTFAIGASCGTKIRAWTPAWRAAHATAWPWLPALAATTPASRSASERRESRFTAPRTLNAPVRWRFSALSQTSRPAMRDKVSELYTGVSRATPAIRSRASRMSAAVGAISVSFNLEHPHHYFPDRRQGIELPPLHLVEQAAQLRVVGHCPLQVGLGAGGCDRENLARQILAPPCVKEAVRLEVCPMTGDLFPQLGHPLAGDGLGEDDRRLPVAFRVEGEDRAHFVQHRLRGRVVLLVDHDHVRDLHDPRLQRLDGVAGARHEHEHHRVRRRSPRSRSGQCRPFRGRPDRGPPHRARGAPAASPRRGRRGARASPSSG